MRVYLWMNVRVYLWMNVRVFVDECACICE